VHFCRQLNDWLVVRRVERKQINKGNAVMYWLFTSKSNLMRAEGPPCAVASRNYWGEGRRNTEKLRQTHIYIYTCIYTHVHVHKHTHTHIRRRSRKCRDKPKNKHVHTHTHKRLGRARFFPFTVFPWKFMARLVPLDEQAPLPETIGHQGGY
jgi:hypothetical protein